jgi:glycerophosphoryl diester phosphodiesterase
MNKPTLWHSDVPLIIAHRGASMFAPENTLAAFQRAADHGADAIELDAKLSSDGHIVVHHDPTLERTTNGLGPLSKYSLQELKSLDAGSFFDPSFSGERIPTLREVFEQFRDLFLINVEMTNYAHPFDRLPQKVVQLVREYKLEERVLLSSFNPIGLWTAHRIAPEIPLGLLVGSHEAKIIRTGLQTLTPHDAFHPQATIVEDTPIPMLRVKGRPIYVWTVNDAERLRDLFISGVDGVFTDDPRLALRTREASM